MVYNKSNQKNKDIVYINENIKAFNVLLLDET